MTRSKTTIGFLVTLALLLGACASKQPAPSTAVSATRPGIERAEPEVESVLARIKRGMGVQQVLKILGSYSSFVTYQTGKAWIPFYYGPDLIRQDWKYAGLGRVVFQKGRFGRMRVLRVALDPSEDGF